MPTINGEKTDAAGMSVACFLEREGYDSARVVVERNLEILPREAFDQTAIMDEDVLEILCLVGGG